MYFKSKTLLKSIALASMVFVAGCQNSPIRNPFAGYKEPGLGPLPQSAKKMDELELNTMWTAKFKQQNGLDKLTPIIHNQILYAADATGRLMALDKTTGNHLWEFQTNLNFSAGPSLIDGKLVLGTNDANIHVFDANTGQALWHQKLTSAMITPASGGQNVIVAKTIDGSIQGLDLRDGASMWRFDQARPALTLRYQSAPKVVGDKVIVGLSNGKCLALNLYTGFTQWERVISIPRGRSELQRMVDISADPIIIGDVVFVSAYQGKLAALNIETGSILWEKEVSVFYNLTSDKKALYLTDADHNVWSIEQKSGITLWKQEALTKRRVTQPTLVKNKLVVADKEGYLHWIDTQNGQLLGYSKTEKRVFNAPIYVNNQLIVRSQKGKLAALNIESQL